MIHKLKFGYLCCCCRSIIVYELAQTGHDHSASDSYQCCKLVPNEHEYEMGNTEDTKSEHATSNEKSAEEIQSNQASSQNSLQPFPTITSYLHHERNENNEDSTEIVTSSNVRQTEFNQNKDF